MSGEWQWERRVEFPSRLGEHLPFLDEVVGAVERLGWSGRDHFGVLMTLEEVLTNAIRHGNLEDASKLVRADARASAERFYLSVEDEGAGFRLDAVPDCTADENLESFGGRGMLLIQAYMEKVSFNDRGNRITVETHRGFRPPATDDD
ncbi:MAG: ATP-binding protein [Lacipirellulaceae bacterium]